MHLESIAKWLPLLTRKLLKTEYKFAISTYLALGFFFFHDFLQQEPRPGFQLVLIIMKLKVVKL